MVFKYLLAVGIPVDLQLQDQSGNLQVLEEAAQ